VFRWKLYMESLPPQGLKPATLEGREKCLLAFLSFARDRAIRSDSEVTQELIESYRRYVTGRLGQNTGRPLALSTKFNLLFAVKSYFEWLVRLGHLAASPAAALIIPRFRRRTLPKGIPTENEMESILSRPDTSKPWGLRTRAILELMYSSGLRRREVCGLDVLDVNLPGGEVRVRKGKGGKDRMVPLGRMAGEWIGRYLKEVRPKWEGGKRQEALFLNRRGERLAPDALTMSLIPLLRGAAPGRSVTCHSFRHAFATHLLRRGAGLFHIQRMLGHARISTTEIYTRVTVEDLKEAHKRSHPRG
jgi:integrase/recombinase XerD